MAITFWALSITLAVPAAAQYPYLFDAPVDMSGNYQVDCATWDRTNDVAVSGCRCPRAPSYLYLDLTEIEEIRAFPLHLRMHYTGELREFHAQAYRSPNCQLGGHSCVLWEGYQVFPLSGAFDFIRDPNGFFVTNDSKMTGTITTHGPDYLGQPIEPRADTVEIVPYRPRGPTFGKRPGDQLVTLIANGIGGSSGIGGYNFTLFSQFCQCGLSESSDIPAPPYPGCGGPSASEDGARRYGDGFLYFTGEQVPAPTLLGDIHVRLLSSAPLVLPDDSDSRRIDRAVVQLVQQQGYIRRRGSRESDADYRDYLRSIPKIPIGPPQIVQPANNSVVIWRNIPINQQVDVGPSSQWRRFRYAVEVSSAETDEIDLEQPNQPLDPNITVTTYFTDGFAANISPSRSEIPPVRDLEVSPLDAIGIKQSLISSLVEICPENYTGVENLVQVYLNQIKDGTVASSDAVLEGLKRGVLAERVTLFGAHLARDLLDAMMDGLSNLLTNLIEEVTGKSGRGKHQVKREAKLEGLQAQKDSIKGRMTARGWSGFEQANLDAVQWNISVLNDTNGMLVHSIAKAIKVTLKFAFMLLRDALAAAQLDGGLIEQFVNGFKKILFTFLDLAIKQGLGGLEQVLKSVIGQATDLAKTELLDSSHPFSYCTLTQADLEYSRALMQSWNQSDLITYGGNRNLIFGGLSLLSSQAALTLQLTAAAGFGNDAGDLVETVGGVAKAHPLGRAAELAGKIVKYASNGAEFVLPASLLGLTKARTEELVRLSFNNQVAPGSTARAPQASPAVSVQNDNLLTALGDTEVALDGALADLAGFLEQDAIPAAIDVSGASASTGLVNARADFERAVTQFIEQGTAIVLPGEYATIQLGSGIGQTVDIIAMLSNMSQSLIDLYLDVLLTQYQGPSDGLYVAERTRIVTEISSIRKAIARLVSTLGAYAQRTQGLEAGAVVLVEEFVVSSDATGKNRISAASESFTLRAHITNISTVSLAGLSALLTVNSPADSVTVTSASEIMIAGGTLAAADGLPGSGADEADVSWQVSFNGDLANRERIVFGVELLESGGEPVSFSTSSALEMLRYDITVRDADLDGMPDDWERANGLNPNVNDADQDADGDGLSNVREYEIGTLPSSADSDGDNLSDGEETTGGSDGFLSDPLVADSDGDGLSDGVDPNPGDADPNASATPPGEPVVAVDQSSVVLSRAGAYVAVNVANTGSGNLVWGVVVDNPALVTTIPAHADVSVGAGSLLLGLPSGLDPAQCLSTIVRVVDVSGATPDYRDITVTVGPPDVCASAVVCGDASGDGSVTATDALIALNAAVGLSSCALNLCDANGDNLVTAVDALMILKFAVGSVTELACP